MSPRTIDQGGSMKKLLIGLIAVAASMSMMSTSFAATGTFKDGPYTGTSLDSGTCGNNWAQDLYTRNFVAQLPANGDGTFTVTEKFAKGHFSTLAGSSPGACNTAPGGTATVKEGISGTFHGTFTIIVTGGIFNPGGACDRNPDGLCTTAGWVSGFFGAAATYEIPKFSFTYNASGQGLILHQWINADTGNTGDIASAA